MVLQKVTRGINRSSITNYPKSIDKNAFRTLYNSVPSFDRVSLLTTEKKAICLLASGGLTGMSRLKTTEQSTRGMFLVRAEHH